MSIPLGGEPIVGILHATSGTASGTAIPIYNEGGFVARVLQADEYIEVHSIEVIAAVTGDTHVFFGTSTTPGTGKTIVRGTVANNSGILKSIIERTGAIADTLWIIAAEGAVDVVLNGVIRRAGSTRTRARYQSSLVPGA